MKYIIILFSIIVLSGCDYINFLKNDNLVFFDNGVLSFEYPDKLKVKEGDFEVFKFIESENIFVNYGDIVSYSNKCGNKNDKLSELLNNIKNGNLDSEILGLDLLSCGYTYGPIQYEGVNIDGENGVILHYHLSQDSNGGCYGQFVSQLIIVKDNNTVIDIVFQNNFGEIYEQGIKDISEFGEICLIYSYGVEYSKNVSKQITDYYKFGKIIGDDRFKGFMTNDQIVNTIIDTVKFN